MPINPAIAMGVRGIELQDPLAQYGRVAAIQQAQQQNALAQQQLAQARRAEEQQNALSAAYQAAYNPETGGIDANRLRSTLASSGFGAQIPTVEKALGELETQKLTRQKLTGEIAEGQTKLIDARLKQSRSFLDTLDPMDPNAPAQYMAWHEANHRDPVLGPVLASRGITADQSRSRIEQAIAAGPAAFAQLINQSKLGTDRFIELNKPVVSQQNLGGTVRAIQTPGLGGAATVVPGSEGTVTLTEAQRLQNQRDVERIRLEGARLGLEGRRVAVLEANARRDADPNFQQAMEAARTVGRKAAEGDVAAAQALPKAISRAEEGVRLIDELIGKRDANGNLVKGAKPHPGFENAVGATWLPGLRFVPGTDAAGFMSRFDQIKGASFLEAFESLKGGGAITEKEGTKGTDAINRMSIATDEKEFISAARDLQEVIRKGVENAQRRVAQPAAARPAAAPAAGGVKFLGFE